MTPSRPAGADTMQSQQRAFAWFDAMERDLARITPDFDAPAEPLEGSRCGSYDVLREIGRGGMGVVYLARHRYAKTPREVALKAMRGYRQTDARRRFLRERRILARLRHPAIARLLDAGTTPGGLPYFVMEFIDGLPLCAYCDRHALSTSRRVELFLEAAEAVAYAHRNRVVHRDIKPGNILVTADGHAKLLDFGIAKILNRAGGATPCSQSAHPLTPEFAAPEQLLGQPVSAATDVYGLGAVLYELLTGFRPLRFVGSSWPEFERAVLFEEPRPASEAALRTQQGGPLLARQWDPICARALAKSPARRYQSVSALLGDIRDLLPRFR